MASNTTSRAGLALPALSAPKGYLASKSKYDLAWGDVLLLLFTPVGSVPMNRQYGCRLWELLFEPMMDPGDPTLSYVVTSAVSAWCPSVVIRSIAIAQLDEKTMQVSIQFSLKGESVPETRQVDFNRAALRAALNSRVA